MRKLCYPPACSPSDRPATPAPGSRHGPATTAAPHVGTRRGVGHIQVG